MTPQQIPLDGSYQEEAVKTLSMVQPEMPLNELHAIMGLCTEVGELQDAYKRMFYGKRPDRDNLIEEMGDIEWYLALLREELGVTQEEVQQRNIAKLRARYGDRFTSEKALNRDTEAEMEAHNA